MLERMVDAGAGPAPWRIAMTREDEASITLLRARGFDAMAVPVIAEGPPPDPPQLVEVARTLEHFDWVICASVRGVRALSEARGTVWPGWVRTAAVGAVTASAIVAAGGMEPVVGERFNADSLWERLRNVAEWRGCKVLVTTVAGGRRELIDELTAAGAAVTEVAAYSMVPQPVDLVRRDWQRANPDAVIVGSASIAHHLIDAVGPDALTALKAVVAIGPSTAAALAERRISATMPAHATFGSAVDHLTALRDDQRGGQ